MKILIVDDNPLRASELVSLLNKELLVPIENIITCSNAVTAKSRMVSEYFHVLILDVILPYRQEAPTAAVGINLLREITRRDKINTPGRIFGITANHLDLENYRVDFEKYFFTLIVAGSRDPLWKRKILDGVSYARSSLSQENCNDRDITCLTIHGVQTRGAWQKDLKDVIQDNVGMVTFENYKYGFYSIFSFFFPPFRLLAILSFEKKLKRLVVENGNTSVVCFAHSFGTYIAVKGIERLIMSGENINLYRLVLAGSVLSANYNFDIIINKTKCVVVNDTGDSDVPLIISQLFVPLAGMAGRSGFDGFNNSRFVNRFFKGGHSHYFKGKLFMKQYWLPLILGGEIEFVDQREDSAFNNIMDSILNFWGRFKDAVYIVVIILVLYDFFLM